VSVQLSGAIRTKKKGIIVHNVEKSLAGKTLEVHTDQSPRFEVQSYQYYAAFNFSSGRNITIAIDKIMRIADW